VKEKTNDTFLGVLFSGVGLLILYRVVFHFQGVNAAQFYRSPAFFPVVVAVVLLVLSIVMIVQSWRPQPVPSAVSQDEDVAEPEVESGKLSPTERRIAVGTVIALVLYTALLRYGGFLILTPILLAVLMWLFEVRKAVTIVVFSLVATGITYYVFQGILNVILPRGYIMNLLY
jgi:putative tricarboxylic transport membrane protein